MKVNAVLPNYLYENNSGQVYVAVYNKNETPEVIKDSEGNSIKFPSIIAGHNWLHRNCTDFRENSGFYSIILERNYLKMIA